MPRPFAGRSQGKQRNGQRGDDGCKKETRAHGPEYKLETKPIPNDLLAFGSGMPG